MLTTENPTGTHTLPRPFADRLHDAIVANDHILARIPDNKVDAQRVIRSEMQIDPSPEMLQMLCRLVHHPPEDTMLNGMLRRSLALHLLAESELRDLLEAPQIDPARLRANSMNLLEIRRNGKELEDALADALERTEIEHKEIWQAAAELLSMQHDEIAAGIAIAPRLERLSTAARKGTLQQIAPSLLPSEARLIAAASGVHDDDAEPDEKTETPSRVMVDALALRSMIQDHLASWGGLAELDPLDRETDTKRAEIQGNLERCKNAYHVIARRLQQHQNDTLAAGKSILAGELSKIQRGLFSAYTKLAPALRGELPTRVEGDERRTQDREQRLLDRCSQADAAVEAHKADQPSQEELMLDALSNVGKNADQRKMSLGQLTLREQRRRVATLGTIAAVLIVAAVGVQLFLRTGPSVGDVHVSPSEFAESPVAMTRIYTIGPMMYAEVSSWSWDELSDAERLSKLDGLGQIAAERGFGAVFLVNEHRRELGSWSKGHGAQLQQADQPAGVDAED